jgi:hypothetical protein
VEDCSKYSTSDDWGVVSLAREIEVAQESWRQALVLAKDMGWQEVVVKDWKLSYEVIHA